MEEGKQGKHQGVRLGDCWNHRKSSCGVCFCHGKNFKYSGHFYSRHGLWALAESSVDVLAPFLSPEEQVKKTKRDQPLTCDLLRLKSFLFGTFVQLGGLHSSLVHSALSQTF